jgi:general secretion pathway protein A
MYLSHYALNQMPFQISPDPKFLWLGEKHKEALAVLKYGVINNQGFLLLTGDVGTGKTTLINALVNSLGSDTFFINVSDPRLDKLDFFKLVAQSFGLEGPLGSKLDFFMSFKKFLHRAYDSKKKVLLIIDEAQKLSLDSLEEIRLLSNIERQDSKLLNIFFVGQNEFNDTLIRTECRALRQRITMVHNIEPLNQKETVEYVKYRLGVAGCQREIFSGRALSKIYSCTRGYPRLINVVCDRAMLTAYVRDLQTVGPDIVRDCSKELSLPAELRQEPHKKVIEGIRKRFSRVAKVATLAVAVLALVLSGYVVASRFVGDEGLNLRRYYGLLFRSEDRGLPERSPVRGVPRETARSSPPTSLPSQSSGRSSTQPAPEASARADVTAGKGGSFGLETSEQNDPFRGSKLVVPFDYNANELQPEALPKLDEVASFMLRKADAKLDIRGYTDALGNAEYNRDLSAFRATVVKSYLAGKGVSPSRMRTMGMGGADPRLPNTTAEGRRANRRVEIELVARKP